jgi:hypothetical protein
MLGKEREKIVKTKGRKEGKKGNLVKEGRKEGN